MSSQYNNPEAGSSTQQKGSISNLTRNLLSSSQQQIGKPPSLNELSMQPQQTSGHPSSYNTSHASSFNKFIPTEDDRGNNDLKVSQSLITITGTIIIILIVISPTFRTQINPVSYIATMPTCNTYHQTMIRSTTYLRVTTHPQLSAVHILQLTRILQRCQVV